MNDAEGTTVFAGYGDIRSATTKSIDRSDVTRSLRMHAERRVLQSVADGAHAARLTNRLSGIRSMRRPSFLSIHHIMIEAQSRSGQRSGYIRLPRKNTAGARTTGLACRW